MSGTVTKGSAEERKSTVCKQKFVSLRLMGSLENCCGSIKWGGKD